MPNLRMLFNDAIPRATLSASTTAGALDVNRLKGLRKTDVWRSTATSATLTATWPTSELVGVVVLPFCNLTSQATIKVTGYSDTAGTVQVFTTALTLANPPTNLGSLAWGLESLGSNWSSQSGIAYGRVWFPQVLVKNLKIEIADSGNPAGYIQSGFLLAGSYWSPRVNPDWNASTTWIDTSKIVRDGAGNLVTDAGTSSRKIDMRLQALNEADRAAFWNLLCRAGKQKRLFVSLFPENSETSLEAAHQIYGQVLTDTTMQIAFVNRYTAPLILEEV